MPSKTSSINRRVRDTVEELKGSGILGCITGSCLLDDDFDEWTQAPDIDVFVYSETAMIHAVCQLEHMGFAPGGKDKTEEGEALKRKWLIETGMQKSRSLSTIMYQRDGVFVNVSCKRDQTSVVDVLANFDMSIVMKGYDIPTGFMCDLRTQDGGDARVATPNKLKRNLMDHPSRFEVWRAVRQWNRVLKYWERGFDTRPMARFYLGIVDDVLKAGAVFGSGKDVESFNEMAPGFEEIRNTIAKWLEEHEED